MSLDPVSLLTGMLGGGGSQTTVNNSSESGVVFHPTINIGGGVGSGPQGSLSNAATLSATPTQTTTTPGGFGLPSFGGQSGQISPGATYAGEAVPLSGGGGSLFTSPLVLAAGAAAAFFVFKGF